MKDIYSYILNLQENDNTKQPLVNPHNFDAPYIITIVITSLIAII